MWYRISQEDIEEQPWQLPYSEWDKRQRQNRFPLTLERGYGWYPKSYLRFGDPPQENGMAVPSTNHFLDSKERGLSVYHAWRDPLTGRYVLPSGDEQYLGTQESMDNRPAYEVSGSEIEGEVGGDGEPLLDPSTVKIVRQVPLSHIVNESDPSLPMDNSNLTEHEIPRWRSSADLVDPQKDKHREIVWEALKRGLPVPDAVLDAYRSDFLYPPYSEQYKTRTSYEPTA
jgi:hypothetical protein